MTVVANLLRRDHVGSAVYTTVSDAGVCLELQHFTISIFNVTIDTVVVIDKLDSVLTHTCQNQLIYYRS